MTYSIVARDPQAGELGVAVASRFFASGSIVPYIRGPRAAVASQAYVNPLWGTEAADRLNAGEAPEAVLADLVARDAGRAHRQCHMIDVDGRIAQFTGDLCSDWAGHAKAADVSAAGNILAGPAVVQDMVTAFLDTAGQPLAARMLAALDAAEAAGGDARGQQSAGLVVSRGEDWRFLDLRVDDHDDPLTELRRLYEVSEEVYQPLAPLLPKRAAFSWNTDPDAIMAELEAHAARREADGFPSRSRATTRPDPG